MSNKKIIFIADANDSIGFGHLNRILILAKELKAKGYKLYIFGIKKKFIKKNLFKEAIEENPIKKKLFNFKILEKISNLKNLFLIVDTYKINSKIQKILFKKKVKWLQFDNLNKNNKILLAKIIVNSNPQINKYEYIKRVKSKKHKLLLGMKYAVLRDEFNKEYKLKKNKILVCSGRGTNDFGMVQFVLKQLNNLKIRREIIVLINKKHKKIKAIKDFCENNRNFKIIIGASSISKYLSQSKLLIIAGGTMLIESLIYKCKRLIVSTADNQTKQCEAWNKLGYIDYLGDIRRDKIKIKRDLPNLLYNSNYKQLKKLPKNLIYNGKYRIIKSIEKEL